jgi:hypothetical protein
VEVEVELLLDLLGLMLILEDVVVVLLGFIMDQMVLEDSERQVKDLLVELVHGLTLDFMLLQEVVVLVRLVKVQQIQTHHLEMVEMVLK